jgi:hypothetical protein
LDENRRRRSEVKAVFRPEVAFELFVGLYGAVGYFYINTTVFANDLHTIAWSVADSEGQASGIGSRYFWVQNGMSFTLIDVEYFFSPETIIFTDSLRSRLLSPIS